MRRALRSSYLFALALVASSGLVLITSPPSSAVGTTVLSTNSITVAGEADMTYLPELIGNFTVFSTSLVTLGPGYVDAPAGNPAGPGECFPLAPDDTNIQRQCAINGSGPLLVQADDAGDTINFTCEGLCVRSPNFAGGAGADHISSGGSVNNVASVAHGMIANGGAGDDRITMGADSDGTITGGTGDDFIQIALAVPPFDTFPADEGPWDISCGPGIDSVIAGPNDTVADDCENVQQAPTNADLNTTLSKKKHPLPPGTSTPTTKKQTVNSERSTYTVEVDNPGPIVAKSAVLHVAISPDVVMTSPPVPSQGTCTSAVKFTCTLGDLAVGVPVKITILTIAEGKPGNKVSAISTATVTSATGDPIVKNNSDSMTVPVLPALVQHTGKIARTGLARVKPFPGVTVDQPICSSVPLKPGMVGFIGAYGVRISENGVSGTTHFTVQWRTQVLDENSIWQTDGSNNSLDSGHFPDDSRNFYFYTGNHLNIPTSEFDTDVRIQIQGKWIHDRGFPHPNDLVLKKTGWSTVANSVCHIA